LKKKKSVCWVGDSWHNAVLLGFFCKSFFFLFLSCCVFFFFFPSLSFSLNE